MNQLYERIPDKKIDLTVKLEHQQWDDYDIYHQKDRIGYFGKHPKYPIPSFVYYLIGLQRLEVEIIEDEHTRKMFPDIQSLKGSVSE